MKISEEDLEDWVAENVESVFLDGSRLIGRQVATGSGRLDLLVYEPPHPEKKFLGNRVVVVELKRDKVKVEAVTQLSRYLNDMDDLPPEMYHRISDYRDNPNEEIPDLEGCLIGQRLSPDAGELVVANPNLQFVQCVPDLTFEVYGHELAVDSQFDRTMFHETGAFDPVMESIMSQWGARFLENGTKRVAGDVR